MSDPNPIPVPAPTPISQQLFDLLIDAVQKKPETRAEALALAEYVYQKDIVPLIARLRQWAVSELSELEADMAQRIWAEVKVVEAKASAWCVPR